MGREPVEPSPATWSRPRPPEIEEDIAPLLALDNAIERRVIALLKVEVVAEHSCPPVIRRSHMPEKGETPP